jgi:hypothetical protein
LSVKEATVLCSVTTENAGSEVSVNPVEVIELVEGQ